MISRPKLSRLAALAALGLSACASQSGEFAGPVMPVSETASTSTPPAGQTVNQLPSPSGYQLSQEELEADCKKLTGRMAVRIVQIRDFQTRNQSTVLARTMQTAAKPFYGGSGVGSDPSATYARDRAMLAAYNNRLAEKNCPNFDIETELAPGAKGPPRTQPLKKT